MMIPNALDVRIQSEAAKFSQKETQTLSSAHVLAGFFESFAPWSLAPPFPPPTPPAADLADADYFT